MSDVKDVLIRKAGSVMGNNGKYIVCAQADDTFEIRLSSSEDIVSDEDWAPVNKCVEPWIFAAALQVACWESSVTAGMLIRNEDRNEAWRIYKEQIKQFDFAPLAHEFMLDGTWNIVILRPIARA